MDIRKEYEVLSANKPTCSIGLNHLPITHYSYVKAFCVITSRPHPTSVNIELGIVIFT